MTKRLLSNGVELDQRGNPEVPTIECAHYTRLHVLNENICNLQRCHHLYQTMSTNWEAEPEQIVLYALSIGLDGYVQGDRIRNRLAMVRDRCTACKRVRQLRQAEQEDQGSEERMQEDESEEERMEASKDDEDSHGEGMEGPRDDGGLSALPVYLT